MERLYNEKTKYGSFSVAQNVEGRKISHRYSNVKIKNQTIKGNIYELMRFLKENFKINQYGVAYLTEMPTSFAMYGDNGLKTQIYYFFSNAKAITEKAKKYKNNIKNGGNVFSLY